MVIPQKKQMIIDMKIALKVLMIILSRLIGSRTRMTLFHKINKIKTSPNIAVIMFLFSVVMQVI